MTWHRLKGSTGNSRRRGRAAKNAITVASRGRTSGYEQHISAGGERTQSCACKLCMRMYSRGRKEGLHNSLFTVECKQRSMERLAIVVHRLVHRISRLIFQTAERKSRLAIENCRLIKNASCGSRLTILLIIYVNWSRTFKRIGS